MFCLSVHAQKEVFYESSRGLGMGGAQITAVNDETTVLINPAGLGKLRGNTFSFLDIEVESNSETYSLLEGDYMRALDPQKVLDDLNTDPDVVYHAKVQAFVAYARRNFSFGFYGNYRTNAQMDSNPVNPLPFSLDYKNDLAFVLGFNKRFSEGRIKIGASARAINRMEIKDEFQSFRTGLSVGSDGKEGIGIAGDIGIQMALPWKWLPTIAAVLRDIGNTKFNLEEGLFNNSADIPDTVDQSLDVGFALYPIYWNYSRFTITGEYRDVLNDYELDNEMAQYHVGFEWNSHDAFFLRGGLNQGYWTAGLEFAFSKFQLQLASFGKEVGDAIEKKESRNFILKFTTRF